MIIFLYGPDTYRSREKLHELKEKYFKEIDHGEHNLVTIDGESVDLKRIHAILSASPFLVSKRMVVLENILKKPNKKITGYILDLLKTKESQDVYLFWEGELQKTTDPLFSFLKKEKYVQEFKLLSPKELRLWVEARFSEYKLSITDATAELLREMVGSDLWQMKEEINKIASYALGTGKKSVSAEVIRSLTQGKNDETIFSFLDALAEKNISSALSLLRDQLEQGRAEIYILSLIVGLFRNLIQLKDATATDSSLTLNEIASNLGIHPYVVRKLSKNLDRFSLNELKNIYRSLIAVDVQLKSERALNPELFIDLLIARLSYAQAG